MSAVRGEVPFNVLKLLKVWTVVVTISPTMAGYSWPTEREFDTPTSPMFDDFTIRDFQASEGQTFLLPCTVRYLGDKVVSWIRSRDLHILTSGAAAFSSDSRFEAVVSKKRDFWGLRIRGVQQNDTGQYECQVNSDPKMSLAVNLTVSVSSNSVESNSRWVGQAVIKGPQEVFISDGSQATFTCEISPLSPLSLQSGGVFMTKKPKVRWLHDNKELLLETLDLRFSIKAAFSERLQKIIGVLQISEVSWRDSGQYTCLQMSVKPDSVKLRVVETEHSEAMQRDFPVVSAGNQHLSYTRIVLFLLIAFSM